MPRFTQHELLDLQEHIRSEAAMAESCRQFALTVTDPDLQSFCAEEARVADQSASRLMALRSHHGQYSAESVCDLQCTERL